MTDVRVIETGTANTASMYAALRRVGCDPRPVRTREDVDRAEAVVLPGVGTAGAALARLDGTEIVAPLLDRVASGRKTLAVCVGLQLLALESEESSGASGLGVWPVIVRRLPEGVRVPQLGWNRVSSDGWLDDGYAYFANSYAVRDDPGPGWETAWSVHGTRFLAAARRGDVLACQFHPELSGAWGSRVMRSWLDGATGTST